MRIIKRKNYFYLQHSYRINGKVKTKEVYLGKEIPKDLKNIEQKLRKSANKELYSKFDLIKKNFQKEWKQTPKSAKSRELNEIVIAFTYNTNAIEGSTITLDETREILQSQIAPNKPIRDIQETQKHAKTFLNMLKKKEKISNELILKWHSDIFGETKEDIAGKYREYLVRVGNYIAPDWQEVRKLMNNLIKFINESKLNPVELAARAHFKFESIHPFGDGNGRIGRLLMNYILWHAGYPMIIIEYTKRKSYYKAFPKGEEGFVQYFFRRYLAIHKKRYTE